MSKKLVVSWILTNKRMFWLKYAHFIDEEPYDSIPLDLKHDDENNRYYIEFFIKTPIYGGKYAIDWGFKDWFSIYDVVK